MVNSGNKITPTKDKMVMNGYEITTTGYEIVKTWY